MLSSIRLIKVPSITPYKEKQIYVVWRSVLNPSSRASFARRSAFFDMENVYFEDYAGVSPQWLAVRVRVQGGLIPVYWDSFLCRPGSAFEPGFMTDGHLPCAAICFESVIGSFFCRAIYPTIPSSRVSFAPVTAKKGMAVHLF